MLRHLIEKEKQKPLGASEAKRMSHRKNLKTVEYDDLKSTTTLKQLLPQPTSGVLILFSDHRKANSEVGHWILLFRSAQAGVEFFDPLGFGYRAIIRMSRNPDKLQKILRKADAYVSKKDYQRRHHAQTCARHCVTRYNCASLSPKDYAALMHDPRMTPDEIVIMLTMSQDLTKFNAK
jgi:hypothetical protein